MRASTIVMIAIGAYVIGRWAHNKPAVTLGTVASAFFLIIVIGMLDNGTTEEIAKGFAWLILAVAVLNPDSPISAIANVITSKSANNPLQPGG